MSEPGKFERGTLIFSVIYNSDRWFAEFRLEVKRKYGKIISVSKPFEFSIDYYKKEMGEGLRRRFIVMEVTGLMEMLVEAKLWAFGFEVYSSRGEKRAVNIDPAILFTPALFVATFKSFSHRVPLSKGVYAHLELLFSKGIPRPLPWTYPDFASGKYNDFLEEAWKIHRHLRG